MLLRLGKNSRINLLGGGGGGESPWVKYPVRHEIAS